MIYISDFDLILKIFIYISWWALAAVHTAHRKKNGAPHRIRMSGVFCFSLSGEQNVHFTLLNLVSCILTCLKMASNERLQLNMELIRSNSDTQTIILGWVVLAICFECMCVCVFFSFFSLCHIHINPLSVMLRVTVIKIMCARNRRDFIRLTEINGSKAFVNSFIAPN